MTPELRRQIFELAALDVPKRQIAARLGISEGSVYYQLDRRARTPPAERAPELPGLPAATAPGAPSIGSPLDEARQRYELERVQTAELNLRIQRQEAEKRLEILQKAPASDQGALLLVLDGLKDLRREMDELRSRPAAQVGPSPAGLFDQLGQLKQGWEAVQAIGGESKLPTTAAELELKVALDRLGMEREERMRRLDDEREERKLERENERIRAEAWAEQLRQWGPVLAQGAQTWFTTQRSQSPAGGADAPPATVGSSHGAAMAVLPGGNAVAAESLGMAQGPCPSCGVELRIRPVPGHAEHCPKCNMALAVVGGKIWPQLPADPVQHFAG